MPLNYERYASVENGNPPSGEDRADVTLLIMDIIRHLIAVVTDLEIIQKKCGIEVVNNKHLKEAISSLETATHHLSEVVGHYRWKSKPD